MSHSHEHGHGYAHRVHGKLNRAFAVGIALNVTYAAAELAAGIWYDSMGLVSDAGHNLSDVLSLVLAMTALMLSDRRATVRYTYGYRKSTILVSLFNAVVLFAAVGVIVAESVRKFVSPTPVDGGAIIWTAGIGVVVNFVTAWLFIGEKNRDLNVKGAYLHMMADALVSVGVVVSGIVISLTGWTFADPLAGLVVAAVIVMSTWRLLVDSLRLSLDGVPSSVDADEVCRAIRRVDRVEDVHHLHIWALSTTESALTAHVVVENPEEAVSQVVPAIKRSLRSMGIAHATIEVETCRRPECDCCR
ncbi:MAG: cation diffusion facilitator family transporter [Alistipes sp.]|nr:cation diffusion facilitator family transporter [Alistipes sp.]